VDASIVIPTYNKLSYLRVTLKSLRSLDFPQNSFEVVVVDDGSQDGTGDYLSAGHFVFRFQSVSHETNRGRSAARNTGLRLAKGRVVVFLDDDMSVVPEFLRVHIHEHGQASNRVVLGNVRSTPEVARTALVRYLDSRGVHKLKKGQQVPFRYFATGNVSAKRDLLLKGGLFDEQFKEFGGEDLELGCRLHKIGAEFAYAPRARSYRSDYADISHLCRRMMTYGSQSLPILIRKHPELKALVKANLLEPITLCGEPLQLSIKKILHQLALWKVFGGLAILTVRKKQLRTKDSGTIILLHVSDHRLHGAALQLSIRVKK